MPGALLQRCGEQDHRALRGDFHVPHHPGQARGGHHRRVQRVNCDPRRDHARVDGVEIARATEQLAHEFGDQQHPVGFERLHQPGGRTIPAPHRQVVEADNARQAVFGHGLVDPNGGVFPVRVHQLGLPLIQLAGNLAGRAAHHAAGGHVDGFVDHLRPLGLCDHAATTADNAGGPAKAADCSAQIEGDPADRAGVEGIGHLHDGALRAVCLQTVLCRRFGHVRSNKLFHVDAVAGARLPLRDLPSRPPVRVTRPRFR